MNAPATNQPILAEILAALVEHDLTPTKFGRLAVNDPLLVEDVQRGRALTGRTLLRVRDAIGRLDAKKLARAEMRDALKANPIRFRYIEPSSRNDEIDSRIHAREASTALLRLQLVTGQSSIRDPHRIASILRSIAA